MTAYGLREIELLSRQSVHGLEKLGFTYRGTVYTKLRIASAARRGWRRERETRAPKENVIRNGSYYIELYARAQTVARDEHRNHACES